MGNIEIWNKFLELINNRVSSISFNSWFKDIKLLEMNHDIIKLVVPYEAQKATIIRNYMEMIEEIFLDLTGNDNNITIYTENEVKDKNNSFVNSDAKEPFMNTTVNNSEVINTSTFNKKYTFDSFIVGDSNRFAYSSALAVAQNPGKLYNPLFLYGKSGLGKTHLMHAIGNYILQNSDKKVLYITSEQFINDFINLSKNSDNKDDSLTYIEMFKNKYRDVDVLMIDDIQFLTSAVKSQQEFTNTFNSLYYNEKQIIICSDRSVDDLKKFEDRLRTRFNWGLKAIISVPDFDLKVEIIKNKIYNGDLAIHLSDEIINFIASNCGNDVRNLEGAITRLHAFSAIMNISELTIDVAMEALAEYTNNMLFTVNTVEKIQNVTANYFNLSVDDLKGKRRTEAIANARMISMYLCRIMTEETYPKIGLDFGGRDHSTVIHAYEKINADLKNSSELDKMVTEIKQKVCE